MSEPTHNRSDAWLATAFTMDQSFWSLPGLRLDASWRSTSVSLPLLDTRARKSWAGRRWRWRYGSIQASAQRASIAFVRASQFGDRSRVPDQKAARSAPG